jgi:pumilio RNA-binding family
MQPAVLDLALSANGTHVIQKALELTGGETQIMLSYCLHGRVRQLLDSHHGNHVLQKSIVMMPPHAIQFILHELSFFRGGWAGVACHRFGCRIVERLLEHCSAELTAPIVTAVVADIDSLSMHPFANYVVQHILEHVPAHRSSVVHALIHVGLPQMAQHRVASNIVERAFEHSGSEDQQALAQAVLSIPGAVVDMACNRYGSFTVRRMLEALQGTGTLRCMALQQLGEAIPVLQASKPGRRIASIVPRAQSQGAQHA